MKVCTIIGARPQFIKAATVSRVISKRSDIHEILIHTGQHYDHNMSAQFFEELSIPDPQYALQIGSGSHAEQTGKMLIEIEKILIKENPDLVLVYGDTNSTLAGALSAAKLTIPLAHVEAGLRSFNRSMPEEINRIVADSLSQILFPPTDIATQQLLKEGVDRHHLFQVGDVNYDAVLFYNEKNDHQSDFINRLKLTKGSYCLATIHRAENTDSVERLSNIILALGALAESTMPVIFPMHPRTRDKLTQYPALEQALKSITIIEPIGYLDMLAAEQNAAWIVTDSGGVQKEAYFNRVPCITLRNETEWVELVTSGWNQLCSPDNPFSLIELMQAWQRPSTTAQSLYGDGCAAEKIVDVLLQYWRNS